jgi:hypothetical protein
MPTEVKRELGIDEVQPFNVVALADEHRWHVTLVEEDGQSDIIRTSVPNSAEHTSSPEPNP